MKLEQQVTNLELSKRLEELGVQQDSQFYWTTHNKHTDWVIVFCGEAVRMGDGISAFTVAELGEMLPSGRYELFSDHIKRWALWKSENGFSAATEADARAKMLIYLLEHNLISIKDL